MVGYILILMVGNNLYPPYIDTILGAGINLTFGNPRLPPGAIHIQPLRGCAF